MMTCGMNYVIIIIAIINCLLTINCVRCAATPTPPTPPTLPTTGYYYIAKSTKIMHDYRKQQTLSTIKVFADGSFITKVSDNKHSTSDDIIANGQPIPEITDTVSNRINTNNNKRVVAPSPSPSTTTTTPTPTTTPPSPTHIKMAVYETNSILGQQRCSSQIKSVPNFKETAAPDFVGIKTYKGQECNVWIYTVGISGPNKITVENELYFRNDNVPIFQHLHSFLSVNRMGELTIDVENEFTVFTWLTATSLQEKHSEFDKPSICPNLPQLQPSSPPPTTKRNIKKLNLNNNNNNNTFHINNNNNKNDGDINDTLYSLVEKSHITLNEYLALKHLLLD